MTADKMQTGSDKRKQTPLDRTLEQIVQTQMVIREKMQAIAREGVQIPQQLMMDVTLKAVLDFMFPEGTMDRARLDRHISQHVLDFLITIEDDARAQAAQSKLLQGVPGVDPRQQQ